MRLPPFWQAGARLWGLTMREDHAADDAVDRLLAQVRAADATASDDFLARLVAAAEAVQPAVPAPGAAATPRRAPRRSLFGLLGGWPALGGMVAATVAGFWVGITPPDSLSTWAATVAGEVVGIGIYGEDDVLALLEG